MNSFAMMTSSNGNIFRLTGPLCREFTGHRWIPSQRPVTRSFGVFFDLRLNKRLGKHSCGWWFEKPSPIHGWARPILRVTVLCSGSLGPREKRPVHGRARKGLSHHEPDVYIHETGHSVQSGVYSISLHNGSVLSLAINTTRTTSCIDRNTIFVDYHWNQRLVMVPTFSTTSIKLASWQRLAAFVDV